MVDWKVIASAAMLATELPRSGFPPQVDGDLMVLHYSFFAGQNAGVVATNQVILDVMVFKNSGVWVDLSGRHTRVVCGHVAIETNFENWHMCGQSPYAQDGCARGEEGAHARDREWRARRLRPAAQSLTTVARRRRW